MRIQILWYLLLFISLPGCEIINPDEEEPAYLTFDEYSLQTNTGQGTSSHKITELWVYKDDNVIGVYDSPARFPILGAGNVKITCYPGIRNNGISTTRIIYPFYTTYDTIVSLQRLQTTNIFPRFRYKDGITIDHSRDFESGNSFASYGNNQGVFSLVTSESQVFEGEKSGYITFNNAQSYFHFKETNQIQLESGNTIFLEMNYSCNNSFIVGFYTTDGTTTQKNPLITLTPTTTNTNGIPSWNKIYLDLGALALANPGADFHELYFEGTAYETAVPQIFLDNLKFVRWS